MANSNKLSRIEIETADGQLTDITAHIVSARHGKIWLDLSPSFWKHPIAWIKYKLELRKLTKALTGLPDVELTISCRYIPDPWRWN